MYSFLQTPSRDVMGQDLGGAVAQVQIPVEYLKVTVIMMMIVLVISYVELITASLHSHQLQTAATNPFQVSKDLRDYP